MMKSFWDIIRNHVITTGCQSHLCICNTDLFDDVIKNGVYGFPHAGKIKSKSFFRSLASLYNIGMNDLIFLYRTNGNALGCKEIHGPFKIYSKRKKPALYYETDSSDFPIKIKNKTDCRSRFLFSNFGSGIYSLADNFELIKCYESRKIWGYRHPAVMNIGAARKKSITSFTNSQTLVFVDLFAKYGKKRYKLNKGPDNQRETWYSNLQKNDNTFGLTENYIKNIRSKDEAFLYCYLNFAFKNKSSTIGMAVMNDFGSINDNMLQSEGCGTFGSFCGNVMMEVIITTHLQDELDIVISNISDDALLFLEVKSDIITADAVIQAERYIDLLKAIFPKKNIFANIVGTAVDSGVSISRFKKRIKLVRFTAENNGIIKFFNEGTK